MKLRDVCKFQNGFAFKSSSFSNSGKYKVVKIKELKDGEIRFFDDSAHINDFSEHLNPYVINNGDILFALTGDPVNKNNPLSWVGRVSRYGHNEPALLNQRVCKVIVDNDSVDKNYLFYYFRVFENFYSLAQKATGSASQANISTKTIGDIEIDLPPLNEQRTISAILFAIDDKIANNKKINHHLEQMAQAIFKSWFVDFEPWGGVMPEGWTTGKAEDFFEISIGKTPPRKEPQWFTTDPQDIVWVSISDMGSCGMFISDSSEYLTAESVSKFNVKIVPSGTVLLSFKLTVGRVTITNGEMTTNEAIAHFKRSDDIATEYLYCYLKAFDYQSLGNTSSIATAVNSKTIKAMSFIMPDRKVLENFHAATAPIFERIKVNLEESARFATLRNTLLPKLMSGEVSVADLVAK